jgi:hypothetical protein
MACYRCNVDGCQNTGVANLVHYQNSSIGVVYTRCRRCFREQPDTDRLCDTCSVCGTRCFYSLGAYGGACYGCFAEFERHPRFVPEFIKNLRLSSDEYWDVMREIDRNLYGACANVCEDIHFGDGILCDDARECDYGDVVVDDCDFARRGHAQLTERITRQTVNKISMLV